MNVDTIFKIDKPDPKLLKLYFIRSLLTGPAFFITFPIMLCRYLTLRYQFDNEGVSMRWGVLFRKEINLTYMRIQDIHLTSGILQRWLGLADIQIQTASGNAAAEMVVEGLPEFEQIRDFLYTRMRGHKKPKSVVVEPNSVYKGASSGEANEILGQILTELRETREAVEAVLGKSAEVEAHSNEEVDHV